MSEFLTTREVAELLRVKERKVYDLAANGRIPCSRATGKLLYPTQEIHDWIKRNRADGSEKLPSVLLGSHDPLLDWALREADCGIASFFNGSSDGVSRYINGEGIAAGMHLFDKLSGEWNLGVVREQLASQNIAVMHWARRDRGLILSNSCTDHIAGLQDLKNKTLVPRQQGSGTEQLLQHLLAEAGMNISDFTCLSPERTESDAVLPLLQGKADATLGLAAVAQQYSLAFVPLLQEQFDIVINRQFWFESPWQQLLEFCRSRLFLDKAREINGYDISSLGTIVYNSPA